MIAGVLEVQMLANLARLQADMNEAKRSVSGAMADIEKSVGSAKAVLASLGIGLGAGYFVSLIRGSIDAADHLNDLSKSTNIVAGDLAGLRLLARQSGTDLDGLAKGINKMSVEIGKDPEKFKALGITARDNVGALKQFADLFSQLPDINQRNALAQAVFSKSWSELAPALSEGGEKIGETIEKGKRLAGITTEMTREADAFNDKWVELTGTGGLLTRQIAPLLPLLNELADEMLGAQEKSGDLTDKFHPLAEAFRAAVILGGNVAFVMRAIGTEAGGFAAQLAALGRGDFAAFTAIGEAMKQDAADARTAFDAWEKKILGVGFAAKAATPGVKELSEAEKQAQKDAEARAAAFLETKKKEKDAYDAIMKKAAEYIKTLEKETAQLGLTVGQKKMIEAALIATTLKTDAERQAVMRAAEAWVIKTEALEAAAAAARENNRMVTLVMDEEERERLAVENGIKALREKIEALNEETFALGATKEQMREHIVLLALEKSGLDKNTEAYAEMETRLRAALSANELAKDVKAAADASRRAWEDFSRDVEHALTDALMRGFESGKDGAALLVDSIRNTLKTAAFKIVVQAAVSPVTGAMGSAFGMTGGAGGGGGSASSLFSMGNSVSNLFGGASAAYNTVAYQALGSMGMEQAAMLAAQDSVFGAAGTAATLEAAGASAFASTIGAALPYLGAAIAVGSMLGLFDGGGDDPHNNPQASGYHFQLSKAGVAGLPTVTGLASPSSFVAGPTSGEGWWGDNAALSAEQVAALNQQTAVVFAQGRALALQLGMDPSAADNALVASVRDGTPGNGAIVGYFSSIEQAFAALADEIASNIIPNLNEFQASGESLAQTAARLSQEFALTNRMATLMGRDAATAFGSDNLKSRDALIQSLGGLSGAAGTFDKYYTAYHSERERRADTTGNISATLRAIGIADVPTTRDQFRALVEGQDLASESGRAMYATLLSVADAFAGITESAEAAAKAMGTDRFRTRSDYRFAQRTGVLPAYASGGDHEGGWAMVGEAGRELAYMPPSRIYSNSDSKSLVDLSAVTQEIASLRADLRAANAALVRAANKTAKTVDKWDGDGLPLERTA